MTFTDLFQTIHSTTYDPAFYELAKSHTLSQPIRPLAALGFVAIGISLIIAFSGALRFAYSDFLNQAQAVYPDDLVVTLAEGQVSINQPEPYYVVNPLTEKMLGTSSPKYLAIFDTEDTLGTDLTQNSTFALIKKSYIITPDSGAGQSKITTLSRDTATTTIAKSDVVSFVASVRPYFIPGIIGGGLITVVLGTIIGTFFWILFHCAYVILPALLIWFFTAVRKPAFSFSESYLTALYASVPVAIMSFLFFTLGLPLPTFGYTAAVLGIWLINHTSDTSLPEDPTSVHSPRE